MDSNESVYEAERVEFGHARTGHSGTGAAAPEQRHRSSRTASNRGARTNISCVVIFFRFSPEYKCWVCVMTSLVL
ncbi:unnamed protein product [Ectocarpus sp. CCAP 1310/34]|nr:unnamed protein product [Ectocarpus sp. CCAP 1310/34]